MFMNTGRESNLHRPASAGRPFDEPMSMDDRSCMHTERAPFVAMAMHPCMAATANQVTVRFLVGIVVFFVAYSSVARLFTAGNSTAAALDLVAGQANTQAPASPPGRSGRSIHRRDFYDGTKPLCDMTNPQHQICRLVGDVRAVGATNTVLYVAPAAAGPGQKRQVNATTWLVKAQSARYIRDSERVTVEARVGLQGHDAPPPACTARCPSPAVVFTVSRHLRNLWHSFADVLVPLFATARAFDRRVQLVVTNGRRARWFVGRFRPVLEALSAHQVVDFDSDREVRCYPQAIVGLRSRVDLVVDGNYTLLDFRAFLRSAYSLPPAPAARKAAKPRLMLLDRHKTRRFVNTPEISAAIRRAGFELVTVEPRPSGGSAAAEDLSALARLTDSCDVLVGAHGAGLAHLLFLRAGSVVVEVVPYGFASAAKAGAASTYRDFFERPARALLLRYVGYEVGAGESMLLDRYGAAHPVISDPEGVYRRGEAEGKPYAFRHYWQEQDIRLNVSRFAAVLATARRHVTGQRRRGV